MNGFGIAVIVGISLGVPAQQPRGSAILPGYRAPVWLDTTGQVRVFAGRSPRALGAVDSALQTFGIAVNARDPDAGFVGNGTLKTQRRMAAQTAAADRAAFASLSHEERRFLDVRQELADTSLACVQQGTTSTGESRRRLQGRLPDGSSLVVFARVRARTGEVMRVEFVRTRDGVQRGITWDADGNRTTGVDWNAKRTDATTYPIPSGGPVPQVLRGLARRIVARCG